MSRTGLLYRPQPSSSESSSVGALFRAVVSTSPGSGWAPGMGCSGVLFHPRSTVAAGVGTGLLRSQRSAPPNDAGLAGEASRRRGPGGYIGGPDSLGFVAAGRPELGAGGFRWNYAMALYKDEGATLDDLREAVTTLEDVSPTARRVLGGAHPLTEDIEKYLQKARAARDALQK